MSDVTDAVALFSQRRQRTQSEVNTGLEGNPDDAARAVELSESTGVPAPVIHADVEGFERNHKVNLVTQMLNGDKHLREFAGSDPMIPHLASDDWGQLSKVAEAARNYPPSMWKVAKKGYAGFEEHFGTQPFGDWAKDLIDMKPFGKASWLAASVLGLPIEVPARLFSGAVGGVKEVMSEIYRQAGGNEAEASKFGADIAAMFETQTMGLGAKAPKAEAPITKPKFGKAGEFGFPTKESRVAEETAQKAVKDWGEAIRAIKPFLDRGEEPPVGIHPLIDELKIEQQKADEKSLDALVQESSTSATRERAPSAFAGLPRGINDGFIEIPAEAIRKLYGDKEPTPDDNLLGWVPDINERLRAAEASGGDVRISIADYVAQIEKENHKLLKDDIRFREHGVTANEAKELPEVEPTKVVEGDPEGHIVDAIRQQAKLDPVLVDKGEPPSGKPPEEGAGPKPIFSEGIPKNLTKAQYAKYEKLMDAERVANAERQHKRIVRELERRNSKEWKENFPKALEDATNDVNNRPIFLLDDFLRNGIFLNKATRTRLKFDVAKLSEEQKASIPERFYGENGVDPDIIAREYNFDTGQQMLDEFARHEAERGDLQPKEFKDQTIRNEAERLMEERFPRRDPLEEAWDHVLTPETFDRLHEETLLLGVMANEEIPFDRAGYKRSVLLGFLDAPHKQQSVSQWLSIAGKAGRGLEDAFLAGKHTEAFKFSQQKMRAYLSADLAKKLEKEQKQFERNAKNLSGLPDVNTGHLRGVPTEYLNWVQHILNRVGRETKRRWDTINEDIQAKNDKTFRDFHQRKNMRGLPEDIEDYDVSYEQSMPVADTLLDETYRKSVDQMTVEEFRAVNDSIKSLVKNGRDEFRQNARGDFADLKELIGKFVKQMEANLTEKKIHYNPNMVRRAITLVKQAHASLLQLETIMDRFDLGNPRGIFTQKIMFPLIEAGNDFSALQRTYSARIRELEQFNKGVNLNQLLENKLFKDPRNGQFRDMTRQNLRAVLLNMGNDSNFGKLAKGYGIKDPKDIWNWIDKHATKQDWDYAQAVGDIFRDIQAQTDLMTRTMSDTAIERIPIQPIQTRFGEYSGWYYPLIRDRSRVKGAKEELPMTQEGAKEPFLLPMTSRGFEKARTGAEYPLDLSLSRMNDHIARRLRDNAFRPVLIETGKIFYNQEFQNAMSRYYGEHYTKLLDPYLRNMAGLHGYRSDFVAAADALGEATRQNLVGVLIGWNPSTPMKHGPTALANSIAEVGLDKFVLAVADMFASNSHTSEANWRFIRYGGKVGSLDWKGSQEINRRMQHWHETIGGAQDIALGELTWRQTLLKVGSYPVAISDLASAVPMWWAAYKKTMEESRVKRPHLSIEEMHADAERMADRAVRRAHGSTAITSRPQAVSSFGAMGRYVTTLYGFFNHIYQRYYRMAWEINEADRMVSRGEIEKSGKLGRQFMQDAFWYVFVPGAVIEAAVAAPTEREGTAKAMLKGMFHMVTGAVPIVRDMSHAMLTGHDPSVGVASPLYKAFTDPFRDFEGGFTKGWTPERKGKFIKHFLTLSGVASGMTTAAQGRAAEFIYRYNHGLERPKGLWGWLVGLRYGTLKKHTETLAEWWRHPL